MSNLSLPFSIKNIVSTRPSHTTVAVAAGVVGGIVIVPLLGPPVLGIFGFSAAGPVAGTMAAGIQAGIGNVVAGSAFAGAQAAAMGAGVPLVGQVIGGAVIGGGAYATAAVRSLFRRGGSSDK